MKTPIVDFVNEYVANDTIRMHMPGHKGVRHLGAEAYDITEVKDADVLYHAEGIIAESEANAAAIFRTAKTVYSTEGSSLCIRAMLMLVTMLARSHGRQRPVIAAGRNAHKTFITAAGLVDADVRWMYAPGAEACEGTDTATGMKTGIDEKACECTDTITAKGLDSTGSDVRVPEASLVSCRLSAEDIEKHIISSNPDAVYITSPDYLGNMADISAIADVCHRHGCLLMVDNAHGAYLAVRERQEALAAAGTDYSAMGNESVLSDINPKTGKNQISDSNREALQSEADMDGSDLGKKTPAYGEGQKITSTLRHPITLGADLCCDSAHKTLPVLTGGAYLHISHQAPRLCIDAAEQAMSMFATTSPSYLIMQSLDLANQSMTESLPAKLAVLEEKIAGLKQKLADAGWKLIGDESIKLTVVPKSCGYTGDELADILRAHNIEPEFSDPDYLVLMPSTDTSDEDMIILGKVLLSIKPRPAITVKAPIVKPGYAAMSIRDALFAASETVQTEQASGRILAEPGVTCPPAIPIAVCGEIIDDNAIACFRYYGIETVRVVRRGIN